MNKEIKENLTGLMITLGTDTERKFAWCLRKINNRPFICIHKNKSYLLTESNREELKIEFINKIDDFVVNQYYINCATENGTIGYPIQYCPICGKNLNKS